MSRTHIAQVYTTRCHYVESDDEKTYPVGAILDTAVTVDGTSTSKFAHPKRPAFLV